VLSFQSTETIHRQEPAMTITEYEYAATTVRALMAAEIAMARVIPESDFLVRFSLF
jgi:hypothetical protein